MDRWGCSYLIEVKTLWEKEKLLVTSNFSFSHNVFKSCLLLMRQNEYLWSKGLNTLSLYQSTKFRFFQIGNFLADDKLHDCGLTFYQTTFADDKINVAKMISAFDRVENVGKGENASYQHFLLFPHCFQKASFLQSLKAGLCGKELNDLIWLKTLWKREKIPVNSNFSFYHNTCILKGFCLGATNPFHHIYSF